MNITQEEFNNKLKDILSRVRGDSLLLVPGIYEIMSEELNNEVIEEIENERK